MSFLIELIKYVLEVLGLGILIVVVGFLFFNWTYYKDEDKN